MVTKKNEKNGKNLIFFLKRLIRAIHSLDMGGS
jgi:hypothetical protein